MSERIQRELLALVDKRSGTLEVEKAYNWAESHPDSALHAALEWDDEVAGREWRCQQIRRLIAVHVVDDQGDRVLVSLSVDRVSGQGYRTVDSVARNRDLRSCMLQDALNELQRCQAKYERLQELAGVWEEAGKARTAARIKKAA